MVVVVAVMMISPSALTDSSIVCSSGGKDEQIKVRQRGWVAVVNRQYEMVVVVMTVVTVMTISPSTFMTPLLS